ncbi:hypothetical protein L1O03_01450 [Corynebacterium uropygiale]|uniref:Uncharacterized protein n=1 Tax=Corynebacterium uropygiale TaxID=1775911 RepID=A0A9X1QM98_9CORY|nr:hypothetical protein [Corynebacterium uropygiale]MCF4005844.1 hypothetical protein [Corynebacterium uropygiale]
MTSRDDETQYIPRSQNDPQDYTQAYPAGEYRDEDFGSRPRQHFPSPEERYQQPSSWQQEDWQQEERYTQPPAPGDRGRGGRSGGSGMGIGAVIGWFLAGLVISGVIFYFIGHATAPEPTPEKVTETQMSTVTATSTVTTEPEEPSSEGGLLPSITLPSLPEKAPDGQDIQEWLNEFFGGAEGAEGAEPNAPEPAN